MPEASHQAEIRWDHPPVSDKKTQADWPSWTHDADDIPFWTALSDTQGTIQNINPQDHYHIPSWLEPTCCYDTFLVFPARTVITWFPKYPWRISSSLLKEKHWGTVILSDPFCRQRSVPGKAVACTVISCTGWYHRPSNCTNYYLSLESGKSN